MAELTCQCFVTYDGEEIYNHELDPQQKAYLTGTPVDEDGHVASQVFDNNVYLGEQAGSLYATEFHGTLKGNADSATKATKDSKEQEIVSTYIKDLSASGNIITYTKGDGSTGKFTTKDTTYNLNSFGITVSANELNYSQGLRSNIQDQLDNKADSSTIDDSINDLSAVVGDNTDKINNLETTVETLEESTNTNYTNLEVKLDQNINDVKFDINNISQLENDHYTELLTKIEDNTKTLTIQGNGTTLPNGTYNSTENKTVNITPSAIGAASESSLTNHLIAHNVLSDSDVTGQVAMTFTNNGTEANPNWGSPYYLRKWNASEGEVYNLGSKANPWDNLYVNKTTMTGDLTVNGIKISGYDYMGEQTTASRVLTVSAKESHYITYITPESIVKQGAADGISSNGAVIANRFYLPNGNGLRSKNNGVTEASLDNSQALIYANSSNRVIVGAADNTGRTEIRSPGYMYFLMNGATDVSTKNCIGIVESSESTFFKPGADGGAYLGSSSYKWKQLYATTTAIATSDRNLKKNIEDLDDRYIELFDLLRPVSYQLISGDRLHTGFIAQDVEEAMKKVGLTAEELGFFCKDIKMIEDAENEKFVPELDKDGNPVYIYSLRYEEYIAIIAEKVKRMEQKFSDKISNIETENTDLRTENDTLREELSSINSELNELRLMVQNLISQ